MRNALTGHSNAKAGPAFLRGQCLLVHLLIATGRGRNLGHVSRPGSQDNVRVDRPEHKALFAYRKRLEVPDPFDGSERGQERCLKRQELQLDWVQRLKGAPLKSSQDDREVPRGHKGGPGGIHTYTFKVEGDQPFLQERKHYSNRASSGVFSKEWSSSGGRRRAPTPMGRLRPGPGGSGGWCIMPGQVCWIASVCCCTAENCWAKPSTVSPNSPAWEMGASRKRALSTSFISTRLSQRWRSWTTMVDIAFQRDRAVTFVARRAKSVAVRSSCINPGSVLPSCTCLSALAWWTCRIAMACRAEAALLAAL